MRPCILAICISALAALCLAQKLQFSPAEREEVVERAKSAPEDDLQRATQLRAAFMEAGCNGIRLREQKVDETATPNVICELPGESAETIIVGAHYEKASSPSRPIDNWT